MGKRKGSGRRRAARSSARLAVGRSRAEEAESPEAGFAAAYERFAVYVQAASGPEEAAAAARSDLRKSVDELVRLACGLDLIKVVSSVRVAMIMDRSATGVDRPAAVLELIALALAHRDSVATEAPSATDASQFMPPHIEAVALAALDAGGMIAVFDSPPSDADSVILLRSVQREVMLRNPVYPHMLLDTLRGLFGNPAVSADCRAVLGFTGLEAVAVMEAAVSLAVGDLSDRFARMIAARDASLPFIRAWSRASDRSQTAMTEGQRMAAQAMFDAVQGLTTDIDQATMVDADAVAERAGCERSTVEAVLDAFTLANPADLDETLARFFRGDNPLRTAPIVTDGSGRRMLVHDALALPAVREVIEGRLKAAGRQVAYEAHRGKWVEDAAIDLLSGVFPEARALRGFNYFVPDPAAPVPQIEPERFTKRVEGDGLILIDDVALIIEVKSVALTAEARGGVARRLRGKLRAIVTDAANQAARLRERIVTDGRIRLDDDQWIDLSGVREIHTIAVGLEDLSGVTTATTALVSAGMLDPEHIPWTVSIHDLRIICELLERPSELLLYLRRRTEPAATWRYRAVDELDLFLLFLNRGLYVEPDPSKLVQELPWAAAPSAAEIRRFQAQHPEIVASQTGPLDAWYDAQLDPTAAPANKPRLTADRRLLDLVDQVTATKDAGWLSTATSLLEGDGKVQRTFGRYATDLAKLVRRDRLHHSITHLVGETSGRHVLLVWACHAPHEDADRATAYLLPYLQAKKHQTGAYRATCMIFDSTGKRLVRLLYDNRPAGPDPALDVFAARLVPVDRMRHAAPHPIRLPRGRG